MTKPPNSKKAESWSKQSKTDKKNENRSKVILITKNHQKSHKQNCSPNLILNVTNHSKLAQKRPKRPNSTKTKIGLKRQNLLNVAEKH